MTVFLTLYLNLICCKPALSIRVRKLNSRPPLYCDIIPNFSLSTPPTPSRQQRVRSAQCVGILVEEYVSVGACVRVAEQQTGLTHHDPGGRRMIAEHSGRHSEGDSFNLVNMLRLSLSGTLGKYRSHGTHSRLNPQDPLCGSFFFFLSFPCLILF